jgi:hypothetical protein
VAKPNVKQPDIVGYFAQGLIYDKQLDKMVRKEPGKKYPSSRYTPYKK